MTAEAVKGPFPCFYGWQKVSLLDFPARVATTLFTFGCNLRCPYCHNPELVAPELKPPAIPWPRIHAFLAKRLTLLDGVCITGGEPLLQSWLPDVVEQIKALGLAVKVDTNGLLPDRLIELPVDFIAMDIKAPFSRYRALGAGKDAVERLRRSLDYIKASGIAHELRTTVAPGIIGREDVPWLCDALQGCGQYVLTGFHPGKTLSEDFSPEPYTGKYLEGMRDTLRAAGIPCGIR